MLDDPRRTYKEIWDGLGTLTLVGTLTSAGQIIPDEWKDRVNYRCTFPIDIRKNLLNADSPKTTAVEHTKKTIAGAYSFVKNNVSANTTDGISYGGQGAPNIGRVTGGEESSD